MVGACMVYIYISIFLVLPCIFMSISPIDSVFEQIGLMNVLLEWNFVHM